jgi:hypothetical protein
MGETEREVAERIFRENAQGSRIIDNERVTVVREVSLIDAITAALTTARQQQRAVDAGIAERITGELSGAEDTGNAIAFAIRSGKDSPCCQHCGGEFEYIHPDKVPVGTMCGTCFLAGHRGYQSNCVKCTAAIRSGEDGR